MNRLAGGLSAVIAGFVILVSSAPAAAKENPKFDTESYRIRVDRTRRKLAVLVVLCCLIINVCVPAEAATCQSIGGRLDAAGNLPAEMRDSANVDLTDTLFTVVISVRDPFVATAAGTFKTQIDYVFETAEGDRVTFGCPAELTQSTDGTYAISAAGEVISATGKYSTATGNLTMNGTLSLEPARVTGDFTGNLCR
jgi:hypothetical protein